MTRAKVTSKSDFAVVQNDDQKMVECENCDQMVPAWTRKKAPDKLDELKIYRRIVDGKQQWYYHYPADLNVANQMLEYVKKELNK